MHSQQTSTLSSQMSDLEKRVKIGAKVVRSGRYVKGQLAEVAGPREACSGAGRENYW